MHRTSWIVSAEAESLNLKRTIWVMDIFQYSQIEEKELYAREGENSLGGMIDIYS